MRRRNHENEVFDVSKEIEAKSGLSQIANFLS
jgi:hypothetical protein